MEAAFSTRALPGRLTAWSPGAGDLGDRHARRRSSQPFVVAMARVQLTSWPGISWVPTAMRFLPPALPTAWSVFALSFPCEPGSGLEEIFPPRGVGRG
jgi:hypothetical protein